MSVESRGNSRRPGRSVSSAIAAALLAILGFMAGCKSEPPIGAGPAEPAPTYQDLMTAHNQRIEQLRRLYADGVVEIRWKDKNGNHYEQGNMELWLQLPRRTALRVEKLGEVRLWLGSDDQRYWLFDLTGDEKVLHTGLHDEVVQEETGALAVKPIALIDLMALTPLPASGTARNPVSVNYDRKLEAWVVQSTGGGGPLRIYFDRKTRLPVRVESLSKTGEVGLSSTLEKYKPIEAPGVSPLTAPRLAHTVRIASTASKTAPESAAKAGQVSGEVSLFIDSVTSAVEQKQLDNVFNLDRLMQSMPPARIDGDVPERAAAAGRR